MKKFGEFICKNKNLILLITIILFIISLISMAFTKINYNILVYLPSDIETVKGQNILTEDFDMGAFSIITIDNMSSKDILKLENEIKEIDSVNKVVSLYDVIGTDIPKEYLPSEIISKLSNDSSDLLLVTFENTTSDEKTLNAISKIRKIAKKNVLVGGMSSMVLDTMELSQKEITIYIIIAVILCLIVLELFLDSYIVPFLLLANIGIAIIFNLGTNIIFKEISYITKALVAVLQLGVTTDFSIFLYHSYETLRKTKKTNEEAMSEAIKQTFTSVSASSITTIAGFLVLCTMKLTLGTDLGLVMAKGVFLGLISVITIFPSLLLYFNNLIDKTTHKSINPNFNKLNKFIINHKYLIFIIFLVLIIPTYLAYKNVSVYYKMDRSLPETLECRIANEKLKEEFNIVSPEIIIIDKNIKIDELTNLTNELNNVEGIDFVLSSKNLYDLGIIKEYLSEDITNVFESKNYQLLLINSTYDIATDELNNQIEIINKIIKKYDNNAILAGEGPLMKDLITISDKDFINVNYTSIICILLIMIITLKSLSLPFFLIITIEFAIFMNMGISYLNGTILPFVAPIVLGTIQLGATIDYAILLTTNYLKNKQSGLNKEEAMLKATNYSANSILISSLCFFAATFGVGLYSDLEMVGSLCYLISRGALISMLCVIIFLPAIILIFDKIIQKTTKLSKEVNIMKRKKITLFIILLLVSINPVNALTKNETVYSKIDPTGKVKNITVTEQLTNETKENQIIDNTILEDIINLSNDSKYTKNNNNITWSSFGSNISYQGITTKKLPISINITYKLNNKIIDLDDALGQKGKIDIIINYQNEEKNNVLINGFNETLYTPFVVLLATTIETSGNTNINVTNGKIINNGINNIIVGISSPGLYQSLNINELKTLNTITISYDTENFSLPTIYNIITSNLLSEDDLEIFDSITTLSEKTNLLQDGINQIEEGSKELLNGTTILNNASYQIYSNVTEVTSIIRNIKDETIPLQDGLTELLNELNNIKNIINNDDLTSIQTLIDNNQEKLNTLEELNNSLINSYNLFNLNNYTYEELINEDINLYNIKYNYEVNYENNQQFIELLKENINTLNITKENLEKLYEEANQMIQLINPYLDNIKNEIANIETKTNQLDKILDSLDNKVTTLYNGTNTLNNGANLLYQGIHKYNQEGISVLTDTINNKVSITSKKIEKLVELGNNYKSYASISTNKNDTTKFIIVLDGKSKEEKIEINNPKEEKENIITRIKNLFKKKN